MAFLVLGEGEGGAAVDGGGRWRGKRVCCGAGWLREKGWEMVAEDCRSLGRVVRWCWRNVVDDSLMEGLGGGGLIELSDALGFNRPLWRFSPFDHFIVMRRH